MPPDFTGLYSVLLLIGILIGAAIAGVIMLVWWVLPFMDALGGLLAGIVLAAIGCITIAFIRSHR